MKKPKSWQKIVVLFVAFVPLCGHLSAQFEIPTVEVFKFSGSNTLWVTPLPGQTISEGDFYNQPGIEDLLGPDDAMEKINERSDLASGYKHKRYQQYHQGYLVEGAIMTTHGKNGNLKNGNGVLASITFNEEPAFQSDEARFAVLALFAELGPVASEGIDYAFIKEGLVYAPTTWETRGNDLEYRLAYRMEFLRASPYTAVVCYVDAQSGEVFRVQNGIQYCGVGTLDSQYNGAQSIITLYSNFLGNDRYRLENDCIGEVIHTREDDHNAQPNNFIDFNAADEVYDGNNDWTTNSETAPASLHWAATMFREFLNNQTDILRPRIGVNTTTLIPQVYHKEWFPVDTDQNGDPVFDSPLNAYWNRLTDEAHYGKGDGILPMVSLDVVGHELTHAMIDLEMQDMLTGTWEGLALNESFADIFGNASETRALNLYDPSSPTNFTVGEDVATGVLRSFNDPLALGHPIAFEGANWDFDARPSIHTNGSVQNYWFYLLAYGSFGLPTANGATVCGIGVEDALHIAYDNVVDRLGIASTYMDSRQGSILAAEADYGVGSFEAIQCRNAWAAVNVGPGSGYCVPTSVGRAVTDDASKMQVFPNPSNGRFTVQLSLEDKVTASKMSLWTMHGQVIAEMSVPSTLGPGVHDWPIALDHLPAGTYQLMLSGNGVNLCKKITIVH